jgi:hypothetical protein
MKQLITCDQSIRVNKQHKSPCSDCPFARTALRGWLAGHSPEEWMAMAHGETRFECHTRIPAQCAGSAIYRANVCKLPHDKTTLMLPADRKKVFASPMEFIAHHKKSVDKE